MAKRGKNLEQLVAAIQETIKNCPNSTISTNVKIVDNNGIKREIDVLVEDKSCTPHRLIAFECKDYKYRVEVGIVDGVIGKFFDIPNINKIVIVTSTGYTAGAKTKAKNKGIDLYEFTEVPLDNILLKGTPCLGNLRIEIVDINFDLYPNNLYTKKVLNVDETNYDKNLLYKVFHHYFKEIRNDELCDIAQCYCDNNSKPIERMYYIDIEEPNSLIKDKNGDLFAIKAIKFTVNLDFIITEGSIYKQQKLKDKNNNIITAEYKIDNDYSMITIKSNEKEETFLRDKNLVFHKPYKSK